MNIRIAILICFVFCCHVNAQDTLKLSLGKALDIAMSGSAVKISEYRVDVAQYGLKAANGNFMPALYLNGSYNRNIEKQVIFLPATFGIGGPTRIGSNNNYTGALDLSLPIFSFSNISTRDYAKTNLELQQEASRGIKNTIANSVKKTYYSLLVSLESVKVMEKGVEHAEQTLSNVQQLRAQGRVTKYDETTAKVKVAAAKNNLLQANSNFIASVNAMKKLLGVTSETTIIATDAITASSNDWLPIEFNDTLLTKNSELKQQEITVALNQREIQKTRSGYYPVLKMVGNYQYISQQDNFDFGQYQWVRTNAVGLQLQVPLYNGMTTRNRVNQALVNQEISKEQREYSKNEKKLNYEELAAKIELIKQRMQLQQENILLAQDALSMARERYTFGTGTLLEVNDAELSVTMATMNWLQAMLDYKHACFDYELLIGKAE